MIEGKTINLSGTEYTVPPLNFAGLEKYIALSEQLVDSQADPMQYLSITTEMVHIALKRNYPDLTKEQLKELLDSQNVIEALGVIGDVSGLKKKATEAPTSP